MIRGAAARLLAACIPSFWEITKYRREIVAAGLAALCASAASMIAVPNSRGLFGCALASLAIAIAVVDARRFMIPDKLTLAAFALGLVHASLYGEGSAAQAVAFATLRAGVMGLLFLLLREAYARLRGRDGIGLGDVKLAAVAGAWLDWVPAALAVELAALAALIMVLLRRARGRRLTGMTPVPFGLFFAPAIWFGWMFEAVFLRPS